MDLTSYIQNYLKTPSTSVATRTGGGHMAVPSRALTVPSGPSIIDGEWSEVPKQLSGPKGSLVPRGAAAAGASGGLASMANPLLAAIMGSIQGDTLNNHKGFFTSDAVKQADAAASQAAGNPQPTQAMPPVQPMDDAPQRGAPELPWWASGDMTKMFPGASQPSSPVPMPMARPPQAPQAAPAAPAAAPQEAQPDTSFFMRNAMMMRDPGTGELIDPSGAASVRGPDLISKMMKYLHNK